MNDSLTPQPSLSGQPPESSSGRSQTRIEIEFQHLPPRHITFERRTGYVVSLVIGGVIVAGSSPLLFLAFSRPWVAILVFTGWALLAALLVFSSHFWPAIAHRHTTWRLAEEGFEIRRGVLWRHRIAIPVARVQHVDVSQGPVQRLFDLGKLTVHTAGTSNASIELDGLDYSQSMRLRDQLIEQKESLDVT